MNCLNLISFEWIVHVQEWNVDLTESWIDGHLDRRWNEDWNASKTKCHRIRSNSILSIPSNTNRNLRNFFIFLRRRKISEWIACQMSIRIFILTLAPAQEPNEWGKETCQNDKSFSIDPFSTNSFTQCLLSSSSKKMWKRKRSCVETNEMYPNRRRRRYDWRFNSLRCCCWSNTNFSISISLANIVIVVVPTELIGLSMVLSQSPIQFDID